MKIKIVCKAHSMRSFQVDKFDYFLNFWVFFHCCYLEKCCLRKMLRFLIKSCCLCSSHQIHFKFATWFLCIMLINVWVLPI